MRLFSGLPPNFHQNTPSGRRFFFRLISLLFSGASCFSLARADSEAPSLAAQESVLVAKITEEEVRPEQTSEADQSLVENMAATSEEAPVPRGFHYRVGLSLREAYDDNINISHFERKEDFYTTIEPAIDLSYGDFDQNYLALRYAPEIYLFADHSENNAFQHTISLIGQYRFPLLSLTLSQDIQILDGTGLDVSTGTGTNFTRTNLDVAGRTRLNIYTSRLNANYSLTGKIFLTGSLSYSISDYPSLISSSILSANVYANYTYSPKLAIGLGVTGGYNFVESPSQDQSFEQINARASYELTGKVSATLSAGVEFRQVSGSDVTDNGSPVFEGNLFYQPFDGTNIALTFSRRTLNSATLASQNFHSTSAILSGRQRFLHRIYFGLSVGYENSGYFSTVNGSAADRDDDYYFLQVSLDFALTSFCRAGFYYLYRESESNLDTYSFYDNQFGLRTSLQY